jgi:AcrR family transcriptional regulator
MDGGYQNLSVADIARELGLAQNAIYWYFASKDHLFVAALQRIVDVVLAKKPRGESTVARVIWFADRLHEFHPLRTALSDRARVSSVVADFEKELHAGLKALLTGALSETVPERELDITGDAVIGLIEGVLMQGASRKKRAELLRFGLQRLAGIAD